MERGARPLWQKGKKEKKNAHVSASSKDESASRQPDTVIFLQAIYDSDEGILLLEEIQVDLLLQKRDYFTCWTDFYTENLILPQGSQHGFMKESSFHFIFLVKHLRCWFYIILWKLRQCREQTELQ